MVSWPQSQHHLGGPLETQQAGPIPDPSSQNQHVSTKAWDALAESTWSAGLRGERETREKQGLWSQVTGDLQRRGDLGVSAGNNDSNMKQV